MHLVAEGTDAMTTTEVRKLIGKTTEEERDKKVGFTAHLIDGPLALLSWGSGAGLALVTLWLRGRSVILSAVSLSLNLVLLVAALVILWLVSHSNFAWH
jgi:hypothetical protein